MTDVKVSGKAVEKVVLSVASFSMTGLVIGDWSGETCPWRGTQTLWFLLWGTEQISTTGFPASI